MLIKLLYIHTHSDTCIHDGTFRRYRYPTTSIFFLKEARIYSFLCNVWQIKLLSIISMASCSDTIWRLRVEWSAQLLVAGILSQMNNIDKIPVVQINPFLYFKDGSSPELFGWKKYINTNIFIEYFHRISIQQVVENRMYTWLDMSIP